MAHRIPLTNEGQHFVMIIEQLRAVALPFSTVASRPIVAKLNHGSDRSTIRVNLYACDDNAQACGRSPLI